MGCYSGVWWYCSIGLDFYQLTEVTLTAVVPRHFVNREAMDASQSSITETGGYFPGQRLNARKSRKDPLDPHSKTKWAKAVSLTAHKILNIGKCPSFGFLGIDVNLHPIMSSCISRIFQWTRCTQWCRTFS